MNGPLGVHSFRDHWTPWSVYPGTIGPGVPTRGGSNHPSTPDSTTSLDSSGVGVAMASVSRRRFDLMASGS